MATTTRLVDTPPKQPPARFGQLVTGLAAALIVVAGCSRAVDVTVTTKTTASVTRTPSASASTGQVSATPTPSVSTPPRPKPLSKAQAAKRYLQIVAPYNRALERLEQAFNAGQPIEKLRKLAAALATANRTHIRQLRATKWPTSIRPSIRQLLTESEAAHPYWQKAASADTRNELAQLTLAGAEHDGTDAANTIRKTLNLDAYNENDYL